MQSKPGRKFLNRSNKKREWVWRNKDILSFWFRKTCDRHSNADSYYDDFNPDSVCTTEHKMLRRTPCSAQIPSGWYLNNLADSNGDDEDVCGCVPYWFLGLSDTSMHPWETTSSQGLRDIQTVCWGTAHHPLESLILRCHLFRRKPNFTKRG